MRWTPIAVVIFVTFVRAATGQAYSIKRTVEGAPLRWHADRVELSLHPSMFDRFGEQGARRALAEAIAAWPRAEGAPTIALGRDTIVEPGFDRARAPVNGVYAVSPWPYRAKLLAITISSYDTHTGELLDTDVLVNADEALDAEVSAGRYGLAAILTHELGHVLGLGETDDDPSSAMYPRIGRAELGARAPSAGDLAGLAAIYAAGDPSPPLHEAFRRFRLHFGGGCVLASALVLAVGRARARGVARPFRMLRWGGRRA